MRSRTAFVGITLIGIAVPCWPADIRLFFSAHDPIGVGHNPFPIIIAPGPTNVPAQSGNPLLSPPELVTHENPILGDGAFRLHLWVTGTLGDPDPYVWNEIAIRLQIDGPAEIAFGSGLNVTSPTPMRRWDSDSDMNPMPNSPAGAPANLHFTAVARQGSQLPPLSDGWDNGSTAVYLGWFDFFSHGARSELRLAIDNGGISRRNGDVNTDQIYFGWGDDALPGDAIGEASRLPDAMIVPEPVGAAILAGASLLLARRR